MTSTDTDNWKHVSECLPVVKPLVWDGLTAGEYRIEVRDGGIATLLNYAEADEDGFPHEMQSGYLTLVSIDDLKEAAQKHWERRILSCLVGCNQ